MDIVPQLIANSLIAGAIYALLAIGFNLIFSTVKFFDVGYGVMTAVGGYAAYVALRSLGLGTVPSVAFGSLVAGIVGYMVYLLVHKPLRKRHASNMVLLVSSLGVLTFKQAHLAIVFSSQFKPLGSASATVVEVYTAAITHVQIWTLALALLVMLVLGFVLAKTRFGKAVRAISDNEEVASIVGINVNKVIGIVFFIGSAIGGLAGIMFGLDTGIEPTIGLTLLLKAIIASIIGGVGNVYGGVVGALVLGFAENFGIWKISGEWKDAIAFGLLIVFLLFRPKGIFKTR